MRRILLSLAFVFCATALFAQVENAQVNGSFQIDGQYYKVDEAIGITSETIKEEIVMKIPGNISPGEWNIYIGLPDKSETLQTHENYFIKFATK